jgi:hypothetical protein
MLRACYTRSIKATTLVAFCNRPFQFPTLPDPLPPPMDGLEPRSECRESAGSIPSKFWKKMAHPICCAFGVCETQSE